MNEKKKRLTGQNALIGIYERRSGNRWTAISCITPPTFPASQKVGDLKNNQFALKSARLFYILAVMWKRMISASALTFIV